MPKERETREIVRRLRKEGWEEENGRGSHVVFRKGGKMICVPVSRKEQKLGTYRGIARIAGWI